MNVATVAAIGIAAYTVTDLTYLGFHAAACAYSGCDLVEIASSAVRKLPPETPGYEPFLVHAGGAMGNLAVFLLGWALTARNSEWPTPLKYFLWLTMTLNGLIAGGQILISQKVYAAAADLVDAEPVGDLTLKGFQRPVPAYNVRGLKD